MPTCLLEDLAAMIFSPCFRESVRGPSHESREALVAFWGAEFGKIPQILDESKAEIGDGWAVSFSLADQSCYHISIHF